MMGRVIFEGGQQVEFIKYLKLASGLDSKGLAALCGISGRTFRDWARGRYSISEKALLVLVEKFDLVVPKNTQIVSDYWYATKGARKGALKRLKLYGSVGTPDGRVKGGRTSQLKRRENPEVYRLLGCNVRKNYQINQPSGDFAEVAGIILGDGAISDNQLRVSLSSLVDRQYALFITSLFEQVFGSKPSWSERSDCNALNLTISGVGLVEELERWGFVRGNKVRHQVDFPKWIWNDIKFQQACVRGLMDTDGGCYFHTHRTNGLTYKNFGMCFTNKSLPIVQSVSKVLKSLGLKFSLTRNRTQIYIYSFKEIKKYFQFIGSSNSKNWEKFNYYLNQKTHRVL